MHGIDISNWQAGIDLAAVPADFVIIKATGGPAYTNEYFPGQIAAARAAGKKVGLYHFARDGWTGTTATQEAAHFLSEIRGHTDDVVLVLDWESDNVHDIGWAGQWLEIVRQATGIKPLIYMNLSVASTYDWSTIAKDHPLWLAWYWDNDPSHGYQDRDAPQVKHWGTPAIWQYTQNGRLPGYGGNLDLNIAYADPWQGGDLLIPGVEGIYRP